MTAVVARRVLWLPCLATSSAATPNAVPAAAGKIPAVPTNIAVEDEETRPGNEGVLPAKEW
jgi:hypothetical protein